MEKYTADYLQGLKTVDGFILKSKSPSCGIREVNIYPRRGKVAVSKRDSGFFGGAVLQKFPDLPVETDGRLLNFAIREHFFTFLYTRARFRWLLQHPTMGKLVDFHARHKYVFLANHQQAMRKMGRLVANPEKEPLKRLLVQYEGLMAEAFRRRPRFSSHINVLEHALGYVSDRIGSEEKRYFLNLLEDYRTGRFPLSALLTVIKSWLIRFDVTYLRNQFYFQPFPGDLVEITDSGKGRKMKS